MTFQVDLSKVSHHPAMEEIVSVLCNKTQKTHKGFFRAEVAYFLGKMASAMHATIVTKDRGEIPVNIYTLALATSGFGKGHSISIMENDFLKPFQQKYMEYTFPTIAEQSMNNLASIRSARRNSDFEEEFTKIEKEFLSAGAYPWTFDSGTAPAVKQLRHKLLVGKIGSINLQMDEIGSNLISQTEVLNLFLELYDQGHVKEKLVKNSTENQRAEPMSGKTPTNMLLFGTPAKLLDGSVTEDQFYSFLDTGYARRCLFGIGIIEPVAQRKSAAQIYADLINPQNNSTVDKWASVFASLADPAYYQWKMQVNDPEAIELLEYAQYCEIRSESFGEHEEIKKSEMNHRYFKALKLAGTYAFIDKSPVITRQTLHMAIKLVEESGEAFQMILNREKPYQKLCHFLAEVEGEVTHADIADALPFYNRSAAARAEMITMATAYGYGKHMVITKRFADNIEFFSGSKLKETSLDDMLFTFSKDYVNGFVAPDRPVKFTELHKMVANSGHEWASHAFEGNYRTEENAIPGFNMIVLDIDDGTTIKSVQSLMKEYTYLIHTTKRHQKLIDGKQYGDRFRMILPMNFHLELDKDDYKEFMKNFAQWLPFKIDHSTLQRSRKWSSYSGQHFYNRGELIDILEFIPRSSRNETRQQNFRQVGDLDALERWFMVRMQEGSRNNEMLKFGMALADNGMSLSNIKSRLHNFNKKLANPLPADEIDSTIMVSVGRKVMP